MTQKAAVIAVLEQGPAHSRDVADETGLPLKHCSAYPRALWKDGVIERTAHRIRSLHSRGWEHPGSYVYWLPSKPP